MSTTPEIKDSLKTLDLIEINSKKYNFFSLSKAAQALGIDLTHLPYSFRVMLENTLRHEDGKDIKISEIKNFADWLKNQGKPRGDMVFNPARVLMQDFTGTPAVVDLVSMREAVTKLGGKADKVNPLIPVDLVIDHSVQVDFFGTPASLAENTDLEMERNEERYKLFKWSTKAFSNFRVIPNGTAICHQANIEYLASVIFTGEINGKLFLYPDSLVGTDSHTTMVNSLGVLGWGVGGIEAESAMLGSGLSMELPEVIGVELSGELKAGVNATDLVLTITNILREKGVVGKFVEFFGTSAEKLSLADRATIANMAPEYGATCGFFPIDSKTIEYLKLTGRSQEHIQIVEEYAKAQGLWYNPADKLIFSDVVRLDLSTVVTSIAGPKRPQDRASLADAPNSFTQAFPAPSTPHPVEGSEVALHNGDVVIAAITSCTNTSNPYVLLAAGLLAKKARAFGLNKKEHVKTSFAPGSQVVTDYMKKSGLDKHLEELGFYLVGYGCTTCIGNSGPLDSNLETTIKEGNLAVVSALSGNRNFEGRIHPSVKANYLMSPPLVVAYAISGTILKDISQEPLGKSTEGRDIYLKDIWPTDQEIEQEITKNVSVEMFKSRYAHAFEGNEAWQNIKTPAGDLYEWDEKSTYIKNPPYFDQMQEDKAKQDNLNLRLFLLLGDSITTDHISPAGAISKSSPAAKYLTEHGVQPKDFNSYGSRRGNHEVMVRGTFANVRIKNEILQGVEGPFALDDAGNQLPVYDAAMLYKQANQALIVVAGKEYGTGSSRDWAAKGTQLLNIKAIIAESFERIHRSNLVGMGVLPLIFTDGLNRHSLNLTGKEIFELQGLGSLSPRGALKCKIIYSDGKIREINLQVRIDTESELEIYQQGGTLPFMAKKLAKI